MKTWRPCVTRYTGYLCVSASRSRSVRSSATVSTGQHRCIYRRSVIQSARTRIDIRQRLRSADDDDLVGPRANTDRFGLCGVSVSGSNQWNKLPSYIRKVSDEPEQFARALKTFLFHTTLTSTSEDNVKRRAIAKTSTLILTLGSGVELPSGFRDRL